MIKEKEHNYKEKKRKPKRKTQILTMADRHFRRLSLSLPEALHVATTDNTYYKLKRALLEYLYLKGKLKGYMKVSYPFRYAD